MAEVEREITQPHNLQELVETEAARLLRSAYLLCGDETEAQDLVQETFLQARKSAHRFRGDSAAYTWLYGILRNLCRRHLRKQGRFVFEEELVLKQSVQPSVTFESDQEFCAATLVGALQRLSAEHREVVVLRYYERLKIEQIAARIGATKGTVKSRLHYAVQHLQGLIPEELNLFAADGTYHRVT